MQKRREYGEQVHEVKSGVSFFIGFFSNWKGIYRFIGNLLSFSQKETSHLTASGITRPALIPGPTAKH